MGRKKLERQEKHKPTLNLHGSSSNQVAGQKRKQSSTRKQSHSFSADNGHLSTAATLNIDESRVGEDENATPSVISMRHLTQKSKKKSGGFQSMDLSPSVLKGILRRGYKIPTPIQRKTIPLILEGKDVVAMARTGSGKTAAFLVPMLEKLKRHTTGGARAVIMSPTRELALQTLKFAKEIGKFTGLKAAVILGGDRMDDQFAALHDSPDVIIATPGRFLHVLVEMDLKLNAVQYVVFDEADRLFEMGFQDQVQELIHRLPESRQSVLFSATLPKSLLEFTRARLTDPTLVRLDVDTKLSENLQLSFFQCREADKCAILLHLLKNVISPAEQTVVFAATKHHVEFLNLLLTLSGLSVTYIYSSLDQTARKINAAKFSLGKVKVLIVTDLAARGIDVPLLDNVINFNFPAKPKLFVHRVGRVARAGRHGMAHSLISSDEMAHLIDLHLFLGRPLKLVPLEGVEGGASQEDGWLGQVPQSLVDDEEVTVQQIVQNSVDLMGLEKVCSNAYKKYIKSRPPPAPESIKRVKKMNIEGQQLGIHPAFNCADIEEQGARLLMLNALKQYKPKATIFEINSTSKKSGLEVMKAKRDQHERIILYNESRRQEQQLDEEKGASLLKRQDGETKQAQQEDIDAVFGEIVSSKKSLSSSRKRSGVTEKSKKQKLSKSAEVKDEENYIQYRPSDYNTERGLGISSQFERDAANAVLDFTNEEEDKNTKKRKWDRKRKKFVTEQKDAGKAKKIKTESGNWIAASYKSNAYQEWRHRTKQSEREQDDRGMDQNNKGKGGKFTVTGMRKRKWHTKGSEEASSKQRFKRNKGGELRSTESILKQRRHKSKVQNFQRHRQNVRAKRAGKEVGEHKGGQRKGRGGRGKGNKR